MNIEELENKIADEYIGNPKFNNGNEILTRILIEISFKYEKFSAFYTIWIKNTDEAKKKAFELIDKAKLDLHTGEELKSIEISEPQGYENLEYDIEYSGNIEKSIYENDKWTDYEPLLKIEESGVLK